MSIFKTLHWDQIYEPLPNGIGCGEDLQYDAVYDVIRRTRQADTDGLPSGMWERSEKKIDWEFTGRQCFEFLTQRSKDLQVSAWMAEAFVCSQGLDGAVRGIELFSGMATTFWRDVHPRMEEGDVELRLRPVNWLLRESLKWFSRDLPATLARHTATGQVHENRHAHWQALCSMYRLLDAFLVEQLSNDAPNFLAVHECLNIQLIGSVPLKLQEVSSESARDKSFKNTITSRDVAYEQLVEIAAFLARVEPHSPVPMVLGALAGWRSVRFEDLLERLPAQGGASVYELLRLFKAP